MLWPPILQKVPNLHYSQYVTNASISGSLEGACWLPPFSSLQLEPAFYLSLSLSQAL